MKVLVVYATVEGHTKKIAVHIKNTLEGRGVQVTLAATDDAATNHPVPHDCVFICAPVHIGRYPSSVINYINRFKSILQEKRSAFVSVSLGSGSDNEEERREAMQYPEQLTRQTGWQPEFVHHAAGALKYLEYDYFRRFIMRRIVKKKGGPTDTTQDYEFTDWSALENFALTFAGLAPQGTDTTEQHDKGSTVPERDSANAGD